MPGIAIRRPCSWSYCVPSGFQNEQCSIVVTRAAIAARMPGVPCAWAANAFVERRPPWAPSCAVVRDLGGRSPYFRASKMRLNGVAVARRKRVNPASRRHSRSRASPACAPNPRPTSWDSEFGVQMNVEAA